MKKMGPSDDPKPESMETPTKPVWDIPTANDDALGVIQNTHPTNSVAHDTIERLNNGEHPLDVLKTDYDMVNPDHYKNTSIETIEKMRRIWGNEATAIHCEMCAFKYRERIGSKPGNSLDQEMKKIRWYESKAKELRNA